MTKHRQYEYNGEYLSLREIAARTGIGQKTLDGRLRDGWTMERATTEKVKSGPVRYLYDGRMWTLKELSRIEGVPASTIQDRLNRRVPLEVAVKKALPAVKPPKKVKVPRTMTPREAAVLVLNQIMTGDTLPVRRLADGTWICNGGICLYAVLFESADLAVLTAYSRKTKGVMLRRTYRIENGRAAEVEV